MRRIRRRWMRVQTWVVLLVLVTSAVARPAAQSGAVITEYYHLDAAGSVRAVTNQAGIVERRYDYGSFGELENVPCTQTRDARLYTGQEHDRETCLDYFGARYYRSTSGRFLTIDPVMPVEAALKTPQLWNRYAYGLNNPPRYVDPDGQCVWDVCAAEGAAVYMIGAAAVATAAYLLSPPGQAAVSRVIADTRTMITTAAGAIGSAFRTEKRPGTLGKPDHRATVEEERQRVHGEKEVTIKTPNGRKGSRRADAVGRNPKTGAPEIVQVYRPTPRRNIPVREVNAAHDIAVATGTRPTMVPVRTLLPGTRPGQQTPVRDRPPRD